MTTRSEIEEIAAVKGVEPRIIEKDYVLGWVLAALNNIHITKGKWIFKGGTCIKKCYFPNYRYSEDLDFTVLDGQQLSQQSLRQVISAIVEWMNNYTGIEILEDSTKIKITEGAAKDMRYAEVRIYYIGPMEQKRNPEKIIFDVSSFEQIFTTPERRKIFHDFSDSNEAIFYASCYCFEELFAEKLRALAQRARQRDLYDVINLHHQSKLIKNEAEFMHLLRQKFARKGVSFEGIWNFLKHPKHQELLNEWSNMLAHQLPGLSQIDQYLDEFNNVQKWLMALEAGSIALPTNLEEVNIVSNGVTQSYVIKLYSTDKKLYHAIIPQEVIDDKLFDTTTLDTKYIEALSKKAIIQAWPKISPILRAKLRNNIVENRWSSYQSFTTVLLYQEDISDMRHLNPGLTMR